MQQQKEKKSCRLSETRTCFKPIRKICCCCYWTSLQTRFSMKHTTQAQLSLWDCKQFFVWHDLKLNFMHWSSSFLKERSERSELRFLIQIPMYSNVYNCIQMHRDVYQCVEMYKKVYKCIQMYTDVNKSIQVRNTLKGCIFFWWFTVQSSFLCFPRKCY